MSCVTDLHALEDCSSNIGHSLVAALVCYRVWLAPVPGWATCPVRWWSRPACVPTGTCSLFTMFFLLPNFWILNFFPVSFHENSSRKSFLKCLVAQWKGEEVYNSSSYFIMLKGFYNNININNVVKYYNTHEKALDSPSFVGQLTWKSEVRRVLWALVVPKWKNFH